MTALKKRDFLHARHGQPLRSALVYVSCMLQCTTIIFERACHTTSDIHSRHMSLAPAQLQIEYQNFGWHQRSVSVPRTHHHIVATTAHTHAA